MTDGMGGAVLGLAGGVGDSGAVAGLRARSAGGEAGDSQAFGRVLAEQTSVTPPAESGAAPPAVPASDGSRAAVRGGGRQADDGSPLPPGRSEAAAAAAANADRAAVAGKPRVAAATTVATGTATEPLALSRASVPSSPDALAEAVRGQVVQGKGIPGLQVSDASSRSAPAARGEVSGDLPPTAQRPAMEAPDWRAAGAASPPRAGDALDGLPGASRGAADAHGFSLRAAVSGDNGPEARIPTATPLDGEKISRAVSRALAGGASAPAGEGNPSSRAVGSPAAPVTDAGADFRAIASGDTLDGRRAAGAASARVADGAASPAAAEARPPLPAEVGASATSTSPAPVAAGGLSVSTAGGSGVPGPLASMGVEGQYSLQAQPGDPAFGEELGARMQVMVREGVREARLQLHPAELGRIQVTVSTDGDQARVLFVADTAGAREAIEQSMPRLRDMLEQQGLQLAQSETQQRGAEGGNGGARDGLATTSGAQAEPADEPADAAAGPRSSPRPAGSVDTYA